MSRTLLSRERSTLPAKLLTFYFLKKKNSKQQKNKELNYRKMSKINQMIKSQKTKLWEAQEGAGGGLWPACALNAGTGTQEWRSSHGKRNMVYVQLKSGLLEYNSDRHTLNHWIMLQQSSQHHRWVRSDVSDWTKSAFKLVLRDSKPTWFKQAKTKPTELKIIWTFKIRLIKAEKNLIGYVTSVLKLSLLSRAQYRRRM